MKKVINKSVNTGKKIFDITNNKKTIAAATVFVLVKLFGSKVPFIVENQVMIDQGIEWALELGVGHKLVKSAWPFLKKQWYRIKNRVKGN